MDKPLIAYKSILINATAERIWDILTDPVHIRQWDELPLDFGEEKLHHGSVIEWPGYSRLSVVECEPYKSLTFSLYSPHWEEPASDYDIFYAYRLTEKNNATQLDIQIGDFNQVKEGKKALDASIEFADTAAEKIKALAEAAI